MNKTTSINLSGLLFNLEEAAFEKLHKYLNQLKQYFKTSEGRDEIIEDIESRIAELFQERLKQKQVILESDVDEVIAIMGQPEEYDTAEDAQEETDTQQRTFSAGSESTNRNRRLFRAPDEGVLGGVCVGVGHYVGIDAVWFRIAFLIALFFFGSGPLIYIILWIALPKAGTTAEKLKMRGEPVTIENIERKIKEEMGRINTKAAEFSKETRHKFRNNDVSSRATNFLNELFEACLRLIRKIVEVMGRSLGVVFLILGIVLFFAWLSVIAGAGNLISFNDHDGISSFSLMNFFETLFSNRLQLTIFTVGFALITLSPIIGLVLGGTKLLVYPRFRQSWPGAINGGLFIIGLVAIISSGVMLLSEFKSKGKIIEQIAVSSAHADTLYLKVNKESSINLRQSISIDRSRFFFNEDEGFLVGGVGLSIVKAEDGAVELEAIKTARGETKKDAISTSASINYFVKQTGKSLLFNPYFTIRNDRKWRKQTVDFTLKIPEGTFIRFDEGINELFYDVPNVQNMDYDDMIPELWRMGKNGLECVSCVAQKSGDES